MADNPYKDQGGYETAWSMGYEAGHHAGGDATPHPPSDVSAFGPIDDSYLGYMQQIWSEGFLAGQQSSINPNIVHHEEGHSGVAEAGHAVEGFAAVVVTGIVERHPVVMAVELFLAVMVPSGAPRWDEEKGDLGTWFAGACREYSWEEFFIPVVWGQSDEAPGWHGQVYRDYESAKAEAEPYIRQQHHVDIAHYRCDSPDMIEVMELWLEGAHAQ